LDARRGRKPSGQLPDGRLTCAIAGADVRSACPFPPINARLPPKRPAPKTHFASRIKRITPVQPCREKYFAFVFSEIEVS
jgi:hypothetical protein